MPKKDGTGPRGRGPKTGRGQGSCNPKDDPAAPRNQRGPGYGKGGGKGQGRGPGGGQGRGRRS